MIRLGTLNRKTRALVLSCSLFASCARPAVTPPNSPPTAVARVSVTSRRAPAAQATPGDDADRVVAEALATTSKLRELPALAPVRGVSLSRSEMASHVKATIERDVPAAVVEAEGEMLVAFGVVPPSFDYMRAMVSLMSSQLAGYYEPTEKTMYLASDLGAQERDATLSHELVHALQDQHYDLQRLLDYRPDESDVQGALHALAEGDATSAMLDHLLEPKGIKATALPDDFVGIQARAAAEFTDPAVPDILKRSLIAPYTDGLTFVHWLRRRGGWAAVDAAWKDPPASTEQLLHPEKYLSHEAPIVVAVPPPPDGAARLEYTDVMGEQSIRLLLEEWLPRRAAADAASGWGGDRIAEFRDDARISVAWHLRYDNLAAATAGAVALRRGADLGRKLTAPSDCVERATLGPWLVVQQGRDVAVTAGPYERGPSGVVAAGTCTNSKRWASRIFGASQL